MDNIVSKYRYPRHSSYYRRKKRTSRETSTAEKIARQAAIAAFTLLLIIIISSINTPVTNFVISEITEVLTKDIELTKAYDGINNFLMKYKKGSEQKDDPSKEIVLGSSYQDEDKAATEENPIQEDPDKLICTIKEQYEIIVPLEGIISSPFGDRIDPFTGTTRHHNGVDIDAGQGAEIKAALGGTVVEAQSNKTYGNYIKIEHENGIFTVYAHCSELLVKEGQEIEKGEIIGKVGDTGLAIGSHLHFEIWKDGKPLDPLNFIDFPL